MIVELECYQCELAPTKEENEQFQIMMPIGPLIINGFKDQYQDYKCPICAVMVKLKINTVREK